ncbi:MAG: hypothetical protein AAFV80_21775 [Bacteroidota bacterium]
MKKLLLMFTLVAFVGAVSVQAQCSYSKKAKTEATTATENANVKTVAAKAEGKKTCTAAQKAACSKAKTSTTSTNSNVKAVAAKAEGKKTCTAAQKAACSKSKTSTTAIENKEKSKVKSAAAALKEDN